MKTTHLLGLGLAVFVALNMALVREVNDRGDEVTRLTAAADSAQAEKDSALAQFRRSDAERVALQATIAQAQRATDAANARAKRLADTLTATLTRAQNAARDSGATVSGLAEVIDQAAAEWRAHEVADSLADLALAAERDSVAKKQRADSTALANARRALRADSIADAALARLNTTVQDVLRSDVRAERQRTRKALGLGIAAGALAGWVLKP